MEGLEDVIRDIQGKFKNGKCTLCRCRKNNMPNTTNQGMWNHIKVKHKYICGNIGRKAARLGYDLDKVDLNDSPELSPVNTESLSSGDDDNKLYPKFCLLDELRAIQRAPQPCCDEFRLLENEEEILTHMMAPSCYRFMVVKMHNLLTISAENHEDLELRFPELFPPDWKKRGSCSPKPEGLYTVDKILNHRLKKHKVEYLVRWVGYSSNDDSWEPIESFCDTGVRAICTYLEEKLLNGSLIDTRNYNTREVGGALTTMSRRGSSRNSKRSAESMESSDLSQTDRILLEIQTKITSMETHIIDSGLRWLPKELKEMMEEVTQICRQFLCSADFIQHQVKQHQATPSKENVKDQQGELLIDEAEEEEMPKSPQKVLTVREKTHDAAEIPEVDSFDSILVHQDDSKACNSPELDAAIPEIENILYEVLQNVESYDFNPSFLDKWGDDDLCDVRGKSPGTRTSLVAVESALALVRGDDEGELCNSEGFSGNEDLDQMEQEEDGIDEYMGQEDDEQHRTGEKNEAEREPREEIEDPNNNFEQEDEMTQELLYFFRKQYEEMSGERKEGVLDQIGTENEEFLGQKDGDQIRQRKDETFIEEERVIDKKIGEEMDEMKGKGSGDGEEGVEEDGAMENKGKVDQIGEENTHVENGQGLSDLLDYSAEEPGLLVTPLEENLEMRGQKKGHLSDEEEYLSCNSSMDYLRSKNEEILREKEETFQENQELEEEDREREAEPIEAQCETTEGQKQPEEEDNQAKKEIQQRIVDDKLKQRPVEEEQGSDDDAILRQLDPYARKTFFKPEPDQSNQACEDDNVERQEEHQGKAAVFNYESNEALSSMVLDSMAESGANRRKYSQEEPLDLRCRPRVIDSQNEDRIEESWSRKRPAEEMDVQIIEQKPIPAKRKWSEARMEFVPRPSTSADTGERTIGDRKMTTPAPAEQYFNQYETYHETNLLNANFPMDYQLGYGQFQQPQPPRRAWNQCFGGVGQPVEEFNRSFEHPQPFTNYIASLQSVEPAFGRPIPSHKGMVSASRGKLRPFPCQISPDPFQRQLSYPQDVPRMAMPPHWGQGQLYSYQAEYATPRPYPSYYPYPGPPPPDSYAGGHQPTYGRR